MYIWGWGPDPDPDFILSTFTSSQCGTWSDTCYSNPQYDKLYTEQQIAPNPQARQAIVFQMQQLLYKDIPELVLYYDKSLEAYNSTKWTGLEDNTSPAAGRVPVEPIHAVLGAHGAAPGRRDTGSSGGSSSCLLVIVGILGAIIVVVGIVMIARRGKSDEDLRLEGARETRTTQDGDGEATCWGRSGSCSSPSCSSCLSRSSSSGFGNRATRSSPARGRPGAQF